MSVSYIRAAVNHSLTIHAQLLHSDMAKQIVEEINNKPVIVSVLSFIL